MQATERTARAATKLIRQCNQFALDVLSMYWKVVLSSRGAAVHRCCPDEDRLQGVCRAALETGASQLS